MHCKVPVPKNAGNESNRESPPRIDDQIGRRSDGNAASKSGVLDRYHVKLVLVTEQGVGDERGDAGCGQRKHRVDDNTVLLFPRGERAVERRPGRVH